ncbi:hypothetical protein SNOG_02114 [Parastagonospora nodorum SN15]|uniref:Uncharacterized protein n=1 Tax=Phaeosphaeria nodorum (strain SN15 / ATCC MYA-4574 / FGSC 10173) TaxID=321614 RepID=Q0V1K0_PHANO|nr:hypothetical protein SNOG_02114 [Parastagonospora nodorum SN15]EAT90326.1 hypothetical protein SNOG_02114 [Parastagonospora nodorum SN15]
MTHTERPERRIPSAPLSLSSQKSPLRETTVTVSPRDVSETANEPQHDLPREQSLRFPTSAFAATTSARSPRVHCVKDPSTSTISGMDTILKRNMAFFWYSASPNVEKLGDIISARHQL